ncbi:hypothetical protein Csp2054_09670 [Curtobacterium sp. 'Ferrero']|uniref:FHA domain-containing protein n=1 Tax=Curtobacterium sp. 'Ferrero' TaxID=2033654 RepID=UPI000BCC50FF|nr:FHA domain-containing protein [Curtobacterium sp. 'Ferrero']PCN47872.1 hypothetical protein Csp2054_09670 [Curtobacterium sp. 'Ferrero']
MTASAVRRPAAPAPVEETPPPPLLQPDAHGRRVDPAADAWLPESTLDPATRAWLTGADRSGELPPAPLPTWGPDAGAPRSAPTHVHGGESGFGGPRPSGDDNPGSGASTEPEPSLDPDSFAGQGADEPDTAATTDRSGAAATTDRPRVEDDPEVTRVADSRPGRREAAAAPSAPSWWIGRSGAPEPTSDGQETDRADETAAPEPQPNDTVAVEPLVDRRPAPRPTPLVAPGAAGAVCHICGHPLEPDDIFCGACGAVRPAVTAAFTGPVVPLPVARPDWAAEDEQPHARPNGEDGEDGEDRSPVAADPSTSERRPEEGSGSVQADRDSADADAPAIATADAGAVDTDAAADPAADRGAAPEADLHAGDAVAAERPSTTSPDHSEPAFRSATIPSSAPPVDERPAVPTVAPLPPIPGLPEPAVSTLASPPQVAPGGPAAPTSASSASDDGVVEDGEDVDGEDVDETRIVTKTPSRSPFVLHFSTGERVDVHGTGLLGRLPRPQPGERFDELLTIHDPGKSVSKTHLELGRDGDDLWVSDRFSGNGTVVRHIDGSIRRCEPGRRYRVERGARVDVGEQFFLVQ